MRARRRADALHLDQAQFAGGEVEAGDVVAQVLLGHVVDLPAQRLLVFHDHPHGGGLGLEVRLQAPNLGRLTLGVRQDKDAREPLDRLKRERPLALEVLPAAVAAGEQLRVARLGHARAGPRHRRASARHRMPARPISSSARWSSSVSDSSTCVADPLDLGEAILARLFEERRQRVFVEPADASGQGATGGQLGRADPAGVKLPSRPAPGAGVAALARSRPRTAARG